MIRRDKTLLLRGAASALLLIATVTASACGWFTEEDANIEYTEDFSFDVPIDTAQLCPDGADCSMASVPTPMDRELKPIEFNVDLDIVELTGRQELADYGGNFRSVNITAIEYTVSDNSLSMEIPPMTIYLGPVGSTSTEDSGVLEMATIPATPPGQNVDAGNATINTENADGLSDLIKSLQTTAFASATPVVKMGEPFPPMGAADIKITVYVTFVANPLDAVN